MQATSATCFHDVISCSHDTIYGNVSIQLKHTDKGLFVEIETIRLRILSVNTDKYESQLIDLYGDKEVNKLVGTGSTLSAELVSQKIQRWINRWSAHNPFSGYVVLERHSGNFVGQIILKPVKDKSTEELTFLPGIAEIGYLSMKMHWRKGYGKEYTHAIVNHLVPCLIKQNLQVKGCSIRSLIATAGCNNTASNRILNTFMRFTQEKERYGSARMWYQQDYNEDGSVAVIITHTNN
jgi:RimJ/RimL family protein N-acetyltransferase